MNNEKDTFWHKTRKQFKKAAMGTIAAVVLVNAGFEAAFLYNDAIYEQGIPLTAGESLLPQDIFGDSINTIGLQKHFKALTEDSGGVLLGSKKHLTFKDQKYSPDYSKERQRKLHLFMHEMTHIWQNQNSLALYNYFFKHCHDYQYKITKNAHFDDFCNEQQAQIIGDYTSFILYPADGKPGQYSKFYGTGLMHVVEEKFPQAETTRKKLENDYKNNVISAPYKQTLTIS
ncbi:MAG: hypothetical protein CO093_01410 [Alphaproteobacteria bacterium CG_4_9_14_3_um_filter_47_13]|nr:MAG: hypothetical protein CO093_01410 [Alphaproteobacteria bacterium CG_4_9_14_3_um_filter_47_13]